MLVLLLVLMFLWFPLKARGSSPVTSHGLKPPTEIHSPVCLQTDHRTSHATIEYGRAANELLARERLVQAEADFDDGRITAEQFYRQAAPLVARIDFGWNGTDGSPEDG